MRSKAFKNVIPMLLAALVMLGGFAYALPDDDIPAPAAPDGLAEDSTVEGDIHPYFLMDGNPWPSLFASSEGDEGIAPLFPSLTGAAAPALSGYVIGIDPGHQAGADYGVEPVSPGSPRMKLRQSAGCVGVKTGVEEHVINLLVALKLRSMLEGDGATVVMTRTESNVNISNIGRASMMNDADVDFWIRIHCDNSFSHELRGAVVLVPASSVLPGLAEASVLLGEDILFSFCASTGAASLGLVSEVGQTAFNWSLSPVVTVEMGYLSCPAEDVRLNRDYYQYLCAYGIYGGILAYCGAPLPPAPLPESDESDDADDETPGGEDSASPSGDAQGEPLPSDGADDSADPAAPADPAEADEPEAEAPAETDEQPEADEPAESDEQPEADEPSDPDAGSGEGNGVPEFVEPDTALPPGPFIAEEADGDGVQ